MCHILRFIPHKPDLICPRLAHILRNLKDMLPIKLQTIGHRLDWSSRRCGNGPISLANTRRKKTSLTIQFEDLFDTFPMKWRVLPILCQRSLNWHVCCGLHHQRSFAKNNKGYSGKLTNSVDTVVDSNNVWNKTT